MSLEKPPINLVVFGVEGTLYDTSSVILDSFQLTLTSQGFGAYSRAYLSKRIAEQGHDNMWPSLACGLRTQEEIDALQSHYEEYVGLLGDEVRLFDQAKPVLKQIGGLSTRMTIAVVTDRNDEELILLSQRDEPISEHIDLAITSDTRPQIGDSIGLGATLQHISQAYGVDYENSAFISAQPNEIKASTLAGYSYRIGLSHFFAGTEAFESAGSTQVCEDLPAVYDLIADTQGL